MSLDLRKYYTFGLSMLSMMLLVGSVGLIATLVYECCF